MKKITKIFNIVYALSFVFLLFDLLPNFDIKNQFIKSFVYLFSTFGSILIILLNTQQKLNKFTFILPIIGFIGIFVLGPYKILNTKEAWKTQTIVYQNKFISNEKIEYQLQDKGALGYNKRLVQILYLTKHFMIVKEIPKDIDNDFEWIKINKEVNELNLKY